MAVTPVRDDHHVVRHCKKRLTIRQAGQIVGVFPEAFQLRPATETREQETYLSAVYFEFFDGDNATRLISCCAAFEMQILPKDCLMRLCVGTIKEQGRKRQRSLRVTHEPYQANLAYAAIRGLPTSGDPELEHLLATVAVLELTEASVVLR
jgi:hypothetical protein